MKKNILVILLLTISYSIWSQNNIGIGTNTPDGSAKVDITATDKGLLIPRVSLTNVTTGAPITSPANGLMVWNTNASVTGGYGIGFYYWGGSSWTKVATGNALAATLSNGTIWIGNASNVPTEQTISSDVTISNTGVATIQDNSVDGTDIQITANATGDLMMYNGTDWVVLASGTSGYVLTGNGSGVAPSYQDPNTLITKRDVITPSGGAVDFVTSGTSQVVGAANLSIDVKTNTQTQKGIVSAPGAAANKDVWGTDASGNPAWRDATNMNNVQNGINLNTSAPNATATDPYIELGGSLVRPTTITTPTTNNLTITNSGTANTIINLTSTGDFDVQDNGTSALFVRDDANVGISTNTPSAKLHVNTTNTTTADNLIVSAPSLAANNATYFKLGRNLANGNIADIIFNYTSDNHADNYLGFGFYGTVLRTTLANDGRFAIKNGLADASALFEVDATNRGILIPRVALTATNAAGPITLPATSLLVYNTATAGTSPNNVIPGYYYNSGTTVAPNWRRMATGNSDAWNIIGNSNTTSPAVPVTYGTSTIGAAENFIGSRNTADLVLGTTNLERMRILSNTTATTAYGNSVSGLAGYIGIGVPVPLYKFHIGDRTLDAGNTIMIGWPNRSGNLTGATVGQEMTRNSIIFPGYRDLWGSSKIGASITAINKAGPIGFGYLYIGETQSTDLAFATVQPSTGSGSEPMTPTERMRITDRGNVGIGTTTPNAPLQFASTIANRKIVLWESTNNDHQYYGFGINNSTLRYQVDAAAANHIFYAGTSATTSNELMRIQGNGNVGIGTATPDNRLTVDAPAAVAATTNSYPFAIRRAGTTELTMGSDATFAYLQSWSSKPLLINGQGNNVGIGMTTAPTQRLDVQGGNARINNTFIGDVGHGATWGGFSHSNMNNTTGYALLQSTDGSLTFLNKQNTGSGYIGFRVANVDQAVILNNGNMGVGTITPNYKLSVNGTLEAVDFGGAGSQNIRIGDDMFMSDLDLANTTAFIGIQNGHANVGLGTINRGLVSGGTPSYIHGSGEQVFGVGGQYVFASSFSVTGSTAFETGGFYADGNSAAIWSPGDGNQGQPAALLYFMDEDSWGDANTNPYDNTSLKSYINTTGALVTVSDSSKKDNIIPIKSALDKITHIGGYEYQFKLAPKEIEKGQKPIWSSGVLAQQVEKEIPTAVEKSENGDYFVNYSAIIPYLIEAIKELKNEVSEKGVAELKSKIASLESENAALKSNSNSSQQIAELQLQIELLKKMIEDLKK